MLYVADEVFLSGTASEITPIRSVDKITVGQGKPGPVTKELQRIFTATVRGEATDPHGWLTYVRAERASARPVGRASAGQAGD
jgi:branched-chain amino acid aminotransferase